MNKLFKTLSSVVLGLCMAVGVGLGIAQQNNSKGLNAENYGYSYTKDDVNLRDATDAPTNFTFTSRTTYCGSKVSAGKSGTLNISYSTTSDLSTIDFTKITTSKLTVYVAAGSNGGSGGVNVILSTGTSSNKSAKAAGSSCPNFSNRAKYIENYEFTNPAKFTSIQITAGAKYYLISFGYKFEYNLSGKDLSSISVKTAPTKTSYVVGDFFDPTGLVIQKTFSDESTEDVTYDDTTKTNFSFDPSLSTELKTTDTSVKITLSGKDCTQTISVSEPVLIDYEKYTEETVEDGNYLICDSVYAMNSTISSDRLQYDEISISGTTAKVAGNKNLWTITKVETISEVDYFTMMNASSSKYAAGTGVNNKITLLDAGNTNSAKWSIKKESSGYVFTNKGNNSSSKNAVLKKNESYGFACYLSGYVDLYLLAKTITDVTVKTNPTKVEYAKNEKFDPSGLVITVTYDDETTKEVTYSSADSNFKFYQGSSETAFVLDTPLTADGTMFVAYKDVKSTNSISYDVEAHVIQFNNSLPTVLEIGEVADFANGITHTYRDETVTDTITYSLVDVDPAGSLTITSTGKVTCVTSGGVGKVKATCAYGGEVTSAELSVIKMHATSIVPSESSVTLAKGNKSSQITITFMKGDTPYTPKNKNVTFASNDETIATVTNTGYITAVSEGSTSVTVACEADTSITTTITVTVTAHELRTFYSPSSTVFEEGQVLNATLDENDSTKLKVAYSDNETKYVTMDANTSAFISDNETTGFNYFPMNSTLSSDYNGKYIYFTYTEGGKTVQSPTKLLQVYYIHMITKTKSIQVGESYTFVKDTDYKTNCNDLTWTMTTGGTYVQVDNGTITCTKAHASQQYVDCTLTLKSTSKSTINDTCTVTASYVPVASITLSENEIEIAKDSSAYQITATVEGEYARPDVTWVSENTSVATVTNTGKISAVSSVSEDTDVNVYAYVDENCNGQYDDGVEKRAICIVHVKVGAIDVNQIIFSETSYTKAHTEISSSTEINLAPQILPINASEKALHWSSDNTAVAKLANYSEAQSKTIQLTGSSGVAVITATSTNESGNQVSATYTITINHDTITALTLDTKAVTKEFEVNKEFNSDGLVANITYTTKAGTTNVSDKVNVTAPDMTTIGKKSVLVSYTEDGQEISSSYEIDVDVRKIIDLELITEPTKVDYEVGDKFTLAGLEMMAEYNFNPTTVEIYADTEGLTSSITPGYTFVDSDVEKLNGKNVTLTYDGMTKEFDITLKEPYSNSVTGKEYIPGVEYRRVTNVSQLVAGEKYVLACSSKGTTAGDISSSVMASISSTFSSDYSSITSLGSGSVLLTLGGSSGSWTFKNASNNYLTATAVKKLSWSNTSQNWSISINDSNQVTIQNSTSSYGRFLYNANNGQERFTTYTSETSATQILPELYRVYLTKGTWGKVDTEYSDSGEALAFARKYIHEFTSDGSYVDLTGKTVTGICVADGSTNIETIKTKWAAMKADYEALGQSSRFMFSWTTANASGNSMERLAYIYDLLYSKHHTAHSDDIVDFADRTNTVGINASSSLLPLQTIFGDSNSTTIIIVTISLVSLTAIGGYFFIHRRKETN